MENVYHSGEKSIQDMVGETSIANANGRVIANTIIRGAINFIEKQPTAVVSSIDESNRVWSSLLVGDFGFVRVPSPGKLVFDKSMVKSTTSDILYNNLQQHPAMGTLFIELSSRRRFRLNGKAQDSPNEITLDVVEAYPNCPKYIQRRVLSVPGHFQKTEAKKVTGTILGDDLHDWILDADTFFVGSADSTKNLDVSHRGGNKGFIEIMGNGKLKIPDYQGNSMYNTLGNLLVNPSVGLLFVDFEHGDTLQLTGKGELNFGQNTSQDLEKTSGTGRFWLFETEQWILTKNHHNVNWEFLDYSPFNP